jgi:sulfonate transport system substrate-binding protein
MSPLRSLLWFLALAVMLIGGDARAETKVRLGFAVQVHTASILLMRDSLKRRGIDLDLAVMRGYPAIQLALTRNELDLAVLGFVNLGLLEEAGFHNSKFIAGVFSGGQSLTLRPGVVVNNWKDLEGKRIGSAPNSYADLLFKSSAKLGGADVAKIRMISFGPPGGTPLLAALRSGEIDGFTFWEPNNAEAAVAKIGYYSSLDIGANPTGHINAGLAVNAEFANQNRAVVTELVRTLVEATDLLNQDPTKFAEVAQKATGTSPEVVRESLGHGKLDYRLHRQQAKALMQMIHKAGITKNDASPAVDEAFDYSYLEQVTGKSKSELGFK